MRNKHLIRNWIILLITVFFLSLMIGFSYWNSWQLPANPKGEEQRFVVNKGEGTSSIAGRLEKEVLIKSALAFKLKVKDKTNYKVEPGEYKLSPAMTLDEVVENLRQGPNERWVTLIEGWRVEEMARRLNSELGMETQEFIKAAKPYEGYLFPDTYLINPDATPDVVVSLLNNTFKQKYTDDLQQKIKAKGLTPEEGVILASLVEREARSDEIRTQVASIILKRLKMGMKLDIDATVRYAKDSADLQRGKALEKFWLAITRDDYSDVKTPFNTYLIAGLPPSPICNPSLSSLKAVANADASIPYLYYYHDSKGNTYYAKTLDEHNDNVAKHR